MSKLTCDHYPDEETVELDDEIEDEGLQYYIGECQECMALICTEYIRDDPIYADWNIHPAEELYIYG